MDNNLDPNNKDKTISFNGEPSLRCAFPEGTINVSSEIRKIGDTNLIKRAEEIIKLTAQGPLDKPIADSIYKALNGDDSGLKKYIDQKPRDSHDTAMSDAAKSLLKAVENCREDRREFIDKFLEGVIPNNIMTLAQNNLDLVLGQASKTKNPKIINSTKELIYLALKGGGEYTLLADDKQAKDMHVAIFSALELRDYNLLHEKYIKLVPLGSYDTAMSDAAKALRNAIEELEPVQKSVHTGQGFIHG